jgi:hypothetical protein
MRLKLLPLLLLLFSACHKTAPAPSEPRAGVGPPAPPEPPRVYIDTSYQLPTGRITRVAPADNLQAALDAAPMNSTIVLQSGATYDGNWQIKPKSGSGWLYIISSAFLLQPSEAPRHPPGTRVTAADASDMARLTTTRMPAVFAIAPRGSSPAAGHVRFVGLEITTDSQVGPGADPNHKPWPINGQTPTLVSLQGTDSITVDRCYIHAPDTTDVNHAIAAIQGATNIAVIDSEISGIHYGSNEAHGFLMTGSTGPVKLTNNKISATTEDVLFGGAGAKLPAPYNGYVPADIEIRYNWLWKDEAFWLPRTTGQGPQWTEKNNLEFKSAERVIVSHNTMENAWWSGQYGSNILLTPRSYQSGPNTVVSDIWIDSNLLLNANWAFQISGYDSLCQLPDCTWLGESKRVKITNNVIKLRSVRSAASYKPLAFSIGRYEQDYLLYANAVTSMDGSAPWSTIFMNQPKCPLVANQPVNLYIVQNILKQDITGDCGYTGQRALDMYMPDPAPSTERYKNNTIQ